MFTGIVERSAVVVGAEDTGGGQRLRVRVEPTPGLPAWRSVELGESIAVNGVCLTAVSAVEASADAACDVCFDVVPETLRLTNLGELSAGATVNLERSLRVGDSFGGHYVSGHVDGIGRVRRRREQGDQILFEIELEAELLRQVLQKGSVAVDGISLTVVEVARPEGWFSFAAIPHTLERTTLQDRIEGSRVNIETDAFGKWVQHHFREVLGRELDPEALRAMSTAHGPGGQGETGQGGSA